MERLPKQKRAFARSLLKKHCVLEGRNDLAFEFLQNEFPDFVSCHYPRQTLKPFTVKVLFTHDNEIGVRPILSLNESGVLLRVQSYRERLISVNDSPATVVSSLAPEAEEP